MLLPISISPSPQRIPAAPRFPLTSAITLCTAALQSPRHPRIDCLSDWKVSQHDFPYEILRCTLLRTARQRTPPCPPPPVAVVDSALSIRMKNRLQTPFSLDNSCLLPIFDTLSACSVLDLYIAAALSLQHVYNYYIGGNILYYLINQIYYKIFGLPSELRRAIIFLFWRNVIS